MSNLKFDENYINEVVKFNSECAAELEDIFTEYQKFLMKSFVLQLRREKQQTHSSYINHVLENEWTN